MSMLWEWIRGDRAVG